MTEMDEHFTYGIGVGMAIAFILATIFPFYGVVAFFHDVNPFNLDNVAVNTDSQTTTFTVIDKDISDNTIYTETGAILEVNKFQWKRLEFDHTYRCDKAYATVSHKVYNCTEVKYA